MSSDRRAKSSWFRGYRPVSLFYLTCVGPIWWSATGCAQILGIDDVTVSPDASGNPNDAGEPSLPTDAGSVDAVTADAGYVCVDSVIDQALGTTAIDTDPESDDFSPSCGDTGSADQVFLWTAPVTDYYTFDTFDSQFDTVLALLDSCSGGELACSNNVGAMAQSETVRKFEQGEQVLVLVDGFAGDRGQGNLEIQRVTCPEVDLADQTFPVELSTFDFGDDFAGKCGGGGQDDRAYHWVAPKDGMYYFRATSAEFRPIVTLIDGPRCSDRVLGCNAAQVGRAGAEVVRYLRSGQIVGIQVDGIDGSGLFTLDIGPFAGPECPESTLEFGALNGEMLSGRSLAPSCGFARVEIFGALEDLTDKTYLFELGALGPGCNGGCDIEVTSAQEFLLYVLESADCSGPETECTIATDMGGNTYRAQVSLSMTQEPQSFIIVVADSFPLDQAPYDIISNCYAVC